MNGMSCELFNPREIDKSGWEVREWSQKNGGVSRNLGIVVGPKGIQSLSRCGVVQMVSKRTTKERDEDNYDVGDDDDSISNPWDSWNLNNITQQLSSFENYGLTNEDDDCRDTIGRRLLSRGGEDMQTDILTFRLRSVCLEVNSILAAN